MAMILGVSVAAILLAIAGLHVHWAARGHWPARSGPELVELVVGARAGEPMPGTAATLAVAGALCVASALVLGAAHVVAMPSWIAAIGATGVAVVLGLRGLGGFVETKLRPSIRGLPYERWNVRLYSPLCLGLAIAIGTVVLSA